MTVGPAHATETRERTATTRSDPRAANTAEESENLVARPGSFFGATRHSMTLWEARNLNAHAPHHDPPCRPHLVGSIARSPRLHKVLDHLAVGARALGVGAARVALLGQTRAAAAAAPAQLPPAAAGQRHAERALVLVDLAQRGVELLPLGLQLLELLGVASNARVSAESARGTGDGFRRRGGEERVTHGSRSCPSSPGRAPSASSSPPYRAR